MTEDPIFIRASALSGYHDCPRRAAARLFGRIIKAAGFELRELPSSIGASVGTGVHAAAAQTLKHKAFYGDLGPEDVAIDAAIEALRESAAEGVLWDRETPELNTAERQVQRMAQTYRAQVAPAIQPIMVEERLEAEVKPGLVLTGHADVIAREPGRVRDLKSGKRMGNHTCQAGAYSLLARSTGVEIAEAGIDFIQRVSIKKPQPDAVVAEIAIAQAEVAAINVIHRMDRDLRDFRDGNQESRLLPGDPWAFPANPSSMLCSSRWCPAHGTAFCREHTPDKDDGDA